MTWILLLAACAGRRMPEHTACTPEPCPVSLQHPALPEGEVFATFTLEGGALVTRADATSSVSVLHDDPRTATTLAERFLTQGVDPTQLDQAWVLAIDGQGVVTEHGVRSAQITELVLTP
jgi:hypothetical protein